MINLEKIFLQNFEINPIIAKLLQVQINRLWNPIKKSVIANPNIINGILHKPNKTGKYKLKAIIGVKFGGCGTTLKRSIIPIRPNKIDAYFKNFCICILV